jgi:DNA polymerase alpha subunit A
MQRCVYAIPSHPLHSIDEMIKLEKDVQESRISPADFRKKLQVSFYFVDILHKCIIFFFLFYPSLSFLPDFCWPELITSVLSQLQDAVSDTKNEVAKHLVDLGVSTFSMAPVKVY